MSECARDLKEKERTFLYIHRLASPWSAQPTVARMQKTPATIDPEANREMRLIRPALPLEGIPTNMSVERARQKRDGGGNGDVQVQKAMWKPAKRK